MNARANETIVISRWPSAPWLYGGVGVGNGFGSSNNAESLKKRRQKERTDKLFGLSISSSSSPPSVSYTEEVAKEGFLDHGDRGDGFNGRGGHGSGGDGSGESGSVGPTLGGSADGRVLLGSFIRDCQDAQVKLIRNSPSKGLMGEVIGMGMCVLGDMATRPNFGLNELDLVFSTFVVESILNFTRVMYMMLLQRGRHQLNPGIFNIAVPVLRSLNNVLGDMSVVALARLTGSQPSDTSVPPESPHSEETIPLEPAIASV
ncbi:unnamed protein product [Calypogeia fissa]